MKYDIRIKISLLYFCHYHTLNGQLKSVCKIWHHQDISVFLSSSHSYGLLCTLPSSVLVSGGKARYLVVWEMCDIVGSDWGHALTHISIDTSC